MKTTGNLHTGILPENQLQLLNILSSRQFLHDFYLAGLKDIAAMKLEAIAGRGSKKDFIDLYFLLRIYSLEDIFSFHKLKYGVGLSNQYHHLKSLVYFADADAEAMPLMIRPLSWDDVKKQIISRVKSFKLN